MGTFYFFQTPFVWFYWLCCYCCYTKTHFKILNKIELNLKKLNYTHAGGFFCHFKKSRSVPPPSRHVPLCIFTNPKSFPYFHSFKKNSLELSIKENPHAWKKLRYFISPPSGSPFSPSNLSLIFICVGKMASFAEAPPGNPKAGEKIFKTKCAQCHTVDKGAGHKQGIFFWLHTHFPVSIREFMIYWITMVFFLLIFYSSLIILMDLSFLCIRFTC